MKSHVSDRKKLKIEIMKDSAALFVMNRKDVSGIPLGNVIVKHYDQAKYSASGKKKMYHYTYECLDYDGIQKHLPVRDPSSPLWTLRDNMKMRRALEKEKKEVTARLRRNIKRVYNCSDTEATKLVQKETAEAGEAINNMNRYRIFRDRYDHMDTMENLQTAEGDYVRSKNELLVAEKLRELGISYLYEAVLDKKGYRRIVPDFTIFIKQTVIHIELLGKFDSKDDIEYCIDTEYKQNIYARMGERVVFIDMTHGIDIARLEEIILQIMEGRHQGEIVSCMPQKESNNKE